MYKTYKSKAPVDCTGSFLEVYKFQFVLACTAVFSFLHVIYIFLNVTPVDVRLLDKHTIFRDGL